MTLYKNKYRVESARLAGWDYSSDGYYFITSCVKNREQLFGNVVDGKMILNEYGKIVEQCWYDLPNHYSNLILDTFVVMPNHIHGIMIIDNTQTIPEPVSTSVLVEKDLKPFSTRTGTDFAEKKSFLGDVNKPISTTTETTETAGANKSVSSVGKHGLFEFVRALKTFSARRINEMRNISGQSVWQSGFYDRIIRDNKELYNVRKYIAGNPQAWKTDKYYPEVSL